MSIIEGAHGVANDPFSTSEDTPSLTTQATGSTFVAFCFGGSSDLAVHDNKGNTFTTPSGGLQAFNGVFGHGLCAYVQNAAGGAGHVFTVTHGGGGLQMLIKELIGAALTGGPDAFLAANVTGAVAAVPTPSITTVAANAAVVSCAAGANNIDVVPSSANGTVTDHLSSADFVTGGESFFLKAVAGSASDTLTFAGQTTFDMAGFTISFAPAGGGGGGGSTSVGSERSNRGVDRGANRGVV